MTHHRDENPPDAEAEVAPDLPGPAYPEQPEDGERPIPLRRMPERTQDPDDWDVESTETSEPRRPDELVAERQGHEEEARRDGGAERDEALATGTEDESGYSTEIEQGAAQPRPDTS